MKFEERVWQKLRKIPRGKVVTYKGIARALRSRAFRAVGTAVGKNPNAPKWPCHRVINASGRIGKYSGRGGVKNKIKLLRKEGVEIKNNKIDLKKYFYRLK